LYNIAFLRDYALKEYLFGFALKARWVYLCNICYYVTSYYLSLVLLNGLLYVMYLMGYHRKALCQHYFVLTGFSSNNLLILLSFISSIVYMFCLIHSHLNIILIVMVNISIIISIIIDCLLLFYFILLPSRLCPHGLLLFPSRLCHQGLLLFPLRVRPQGLLLFPSRLCHQRIVFVTFEVTPSRCVLLGVYWACRLCQQGIVLTWLVPTHFYFITVNLSE